MPNEPLYESFITLFDLQVEKNHKLSAVFVAPPSLCACVTVATERATIIYSLSYLEPLVKVPGDQLALEPTGAAVVTTSSKLPKKCYKQTGPQEL